MDSLSLRLASLLVMDLLSRVEREVRLVVGVVEVVQEDAEVVKQGGKRRG